MTVIQNSKEYKEHDLKRGVDFIGVTVAFFCHDGRGNLLYHWRSEKCRDEQDRWDVGAGSMEFGETFEDAVRREIKEEYGVKPLKLDLARANNVLRMYNGKQTHWICIIFVALVDPKKVIIGDPKKMTKIKWFPIDQLPEPRHSMIDEHLQIVRESGTL